MVYTLFERRTTKLFGFIPYSSIVAVMEHNDELKKCNDEILSLPKGFITKWHCEIGRLFNYDMLSMSSVMIGARRFSFEFPTWEEYKAAYADKVPGWNPTPASPTNE